MGLIKNDILNFNPLPFLYYLIIEFLEFLM